MSITNIERMSQDACTKFFDFCAENHPELLKLHKKLTSSLSRYIVYQELPELLAPISMSYKEAFAIMGYDLGLANEEEEKLCALFEGMDEDDPRLHLIERTLLALQPSYWSKPELDLEYVSPTERIFPTISRKHSRLDKVSLLQHAEDASWSASLAAVIKDSCRTNRLDTAAFPDLIKMWDLPPRWIFCIPYNSTTRVIAKTVMADRLIDLFIRLGEQDKPIAAATINKIYNEEGRGVK